MIILNKQWKARFTQDMDILLSPRQFSVSLFVKRLRDTHYHVDEIAVNRASSGGFFNVIHLGYHIKTDFYVPVEPELLAMVADRTYLPFDEMRQAAYVSAEGTIASKLHAFAQSRSTRHLDDIGSIIRVQSSKLDAGTIDAVAARLGVLGAWRALWAANETD